MTAAATRVGTPIAQQLSTLLDVAEQVAAPMQPALPVIDRDAIALGLAGVHPSFLRHARSESATAYRLTHCCEPPAFREAPTFYVSNHPTRRMAQPMTTTPHRLDLHAHAVTPACRAALARAGVELIGGIPVPPWSPELALEFMDAHGIRRQYLSLSDPGVDFLRPKEACSLARESNDELAAVAVESAERFGAFATVSLHNVDAACAEATRALDELALDGVVILSSTTDGRYLGDPALDPLLAELDRRGAWVFVHPTAVPRDARPQYAIPNFIAEYPFDTTRTFISLLFNGAFDRYQRIRWQFAHGGGTLPMLHKRIRALAQYAPLAVDALGLPEGARSLDGDSAPSAFSRSFFDTALIADRPALLAVNAIGGPERLVFGSDWPFAALMYGPSGDPQPELGEVFDPDSRRLIDHHNAKQELT